MDMFYFNSKGVKSKQSCCVSAKEASTQVKKASENKFQRRIKKKN